MQWKSIPSFPDYEVSDEGQVRKISNGHIIPQWESRSGHAKKKHWKTIPYYAVTFYVNGESIHRSVHRLVLQAFVGPCPEGMEACHNDGNSLNNHLNNLRWDYRSSNQLDAVKQGTHSAIKLTPGQVAEIRSSAEPMLTLAKKYGVSRRTIRAVLLNLTWRHLPETTQEQQNIFRRQSDWKLSPEKAKEIRASALGVKELAQKYGVTPSSIRNVLNNRTYFEPNLQYETAGSSA
jgi:ribosomal protein L17